MRRVSAALTADDILARYGLEMTWDMKAGLMGKVQREAAEYLFSFFPGLEDKISVDEYLAERVDMQDALFRQVPPMRGALALVQGLHEEGIPIALATGSTKRNFDVKTVSGERAGGWRWGEGRRGEVRLWSAEGSAGGGKLALSLRRTAQLSPIR